MKVFIDSEERWFYKENGYVVFDPFLSQEKLNEVHAWIQTTLAKRLQTFERNLPLLASEKLIRVGRDLWRDNTGILHFEQSRTLTHAASDLLNSKRFILGFDQYLPATKGEVPSYPSLYPDQAPFQELFAVQGIMGCAIICLKGNSEERTSPFPTGTGEVTFIAPETPVRLADLQNNRDCDYLLVGFATPEGTYVKRDKDPNTNSAKEHGLEFGDLLVRHGHPMLWG